MKSSADGKENAIWEARGLSWEWLKSLCSLSWFESLNVFGQMSQTKGFTSSCDGRWTFEIFLFLELDITSHKSDKWGPCSSRQTWCSPGRPLSSQSWAWRGTRPRWGCFKWSSPRRCRSAPASHSLHPSGSYWLHSRTYHHSWIDWVMAHNLFPFEHPGVVRKNLAS